MIRMWGVGLGGDVVAQVLGGGSPAGVGDGLPRDARGVVCRLRVHDPTSQEVKLKSRGTLIHTC